MTSMKLAGGVLALAALLALGTAPAQAGTKYQTTLVPNVAGTMPGFSAKGSSVKLDGSRHMLSGKLKNVIDGTGARVTTDTTMPGDNYSVEVDLSIPAVPATTTVTASFDLMNGNGKFAVDLGTDPVFAAAVVGQGVAVLAVRVKDSTGTVIGVGGIAKE